MHRAKAFFFVCAGVFLLALAYHLGATSATAQATSVAEVLGVDSGSGAAAVVGRIMYIKGGGTLNPMLTSPPVPGVERIVACAPYRVLLENGDVYSWTGNPQPWDYDGRLDLPGGVPTTQQSWGSVKQRYLSPDAARPDRGQASRPRR